MTSVGFGSETAETMQLGRSFHFNDTVSDFSGSDITHLADAVLGDGTIGDAQNAAGVGGTQSITDETQTAELFGPGNDSGGNFSDTPDLEKATIGTRVAYDLIV